MSGRFLRLRVCSECGESGRLAALRFLFGGLREFEAWIS